MIGGTKGARLRLDRVRADATRMLRGSEADRREVQRDWFFSLARRFTPLVVAEWPTGRFVLPTNDDVVGRLSFVREPFELDAVLALERDLPRVLGRTFEIRGRTVVEVGANIGTTTIALVNTLGAARVVSCEPAPTNVELLRATVAINGLTDRVSVHGVGLSDEPRTASMETSPRNTGDYRVRVDGAAEVGDLQREAEFGTVEVPLVTFDSLAGEAFSLDDVGLVWLDVQGHEGHVLAGASKLLERDIPIVAEYWPYGLRRAGGLERFEEIVRASFGSVYDVERSELLPASAVGDLRDRYADHNAYTNLVLLKHEPS